MNLNQLELFCQVARVKSFSKAAKLLHMTQPAVSQQIQSLESYYGVKLFDRTSHGVTLTPAGEVVFNYARQLLDIHQQMERELDLVLGLEKEELIIGASSIIGNHALPCSIWEFQDKYPHVKIKLEIGSTREIIQKVLEQKVQIGMVEGCTNLEIPGSLVKRTVASDEVVVIVPNKDFWVKKEDITLEELTKQRFILPEKGSGLREALEHALESRGVKISQFNVVTEMSSFEGIKAAVSAGHAISFGPRRGIQKELRQGTIKALPVRDLPMEIEFCLLYIDNRFLNPVAKRFIRFIAPETLEFC